MQDFKRYLPSKKFTFIILLIIVFISIFLMVKGLFTLLRANKSQNAGGKQVEVTIGTVIQKDSNNNGIADWEEYLWGLNPNKSGSENKEFILSKKNELEKNGVISIADDSKAITNNEILSREFFATIVSLQQTGNLNAESIKSVSDTIGKNIEASVFEDIYTKDMLTIKDDSEDSKANYSGDFIILAMKYSDKDIGSELTLISQGIAKSDQSALYAASTIASAYKSFGAELIKIPVPKSASSIVVSLANNYEKTGKSIDGLIQVLTDPIIGMKSIISYKKYNDALIYDIGRLTEVLK